MLSGAIESWRNWLTPLREGDDKWLDATELGDQRFGQPIREVAERPSLTFVLEVQHRDVPRVEPARRGPAPGARRPDGKVCGERHHDGGHRRDAPQRAARTLTARSRVARRWAPVAADGVFNASANSAVVG